MGSKWEVWGKEGRVEPDRGSVQGERELLVAAAADLKVILCAGVVQFNGILR